ncbi:hypothetical protein GCM10018962_38770 [Dactylosporangium matsuzakiense]|uniref:YndJ-like protein n=1 Tax=Dactylosporangium matsuzakiense TaxID=53360 RepID=A0A9W6KTD0_9ACTN|nr:hypothetical protein GCM10017581_079190 [Dactylosporangium matsuzakiense]
MGLAAWARLLVAALVGLGMLVVVPLGLGLIAGGDGWPLRRRWVWFAGAVPGAVSLWLSRGPLATVLAAAYLAVALVLAAGAPRWLVRGTFTNASVASAVPGWRGWLARGDLAVATALVTPAIAGAALVAERAGLRLFGFRLDTLALTEAHFHYAGFAAALVAGLVAGGGGRAGRAAALAVPGGTLIVLAGFFLGKWVEFAGAAVLTAGMWLAAWAARCSARGGDRAARLPLTVSGVVLAATMLLALDWAAGHVMPVPHLSLTWMAATHGVANALGFALCTLLAWRRLRSTGPRPRAAGPVAPGFRSAGAEAGAPRGPLGLDVDRAAGEAVVLDERALDQAAGFALARDVGGSGAGGGNGEVVDGVLENP